MTLSYYSTTRETALTGAATAGDTTLYLADGSTFPDPAVPGNGDYTVIVGYGSDREEICTVTAKPGANIITVTRGEDGSTATTKNAGDVVVHGVSARDWSGLVQIAGSTMTGALFLRALAPVTAREAAPKEYVDDSVADRATVSMVTDLDDELTAAIGDAMPIGVILPYGGLTAPNSNWHLCDGTAHGSSALQSITGSANTPDLRNRFVVGAGSTYSRGDTGGEATHVLTASEMPSHAHSYTAPTTTVNSDQGTQYNSGYNMGSVAVTPASNTSGSAGSGAAHENRPPYYALVYIIKKA